MANTTIQISEELKSTLEKRKIVEGETYEDVIWDLVEDTMVLNEETKKDIARALADVKAGRWKSLEQIKKERGL